MSAAPMRMYHLSEIGSPFSVDACACPSPSCAPEHLPGPMHSDWTNCRRATAHELAFSLAFDSGLPAEEQQPTSAGSSVHQPHTDTPDHGPLSALRRELLAAGTSKLSCNFFAVDSPGSSFKESSEGSTRAIDIPSGVGGEPHTPLEKQIKLMITMASPPDSAAMHLPHQPWGVTSPNLQDSQHAPI